MFVCHLTENTMDCLDLKRLLKTKANLKTIIKHDIDDTLIKYQEIFRSIESSIIIIFYLNKSYFNSEDFRVEYEHAKDLNKIIIFILTEDLNLNEKIYLKGVDDSSIIRIYKNDFSDISKGLWHGDEFHKLIFRIYSAFSKQHLVDFNINTKNTSLSEIKWNDYSIGLTETLYGKSVVKVAEIKSLNEFECTSVLKIDNHLVAFSSGENSIVISKYNHNIEVVEKYELYDVKQHINGACYIKDLNHICLTSSQNGNLLILDKYFILLNKKRLEHFDLRFKINDIHYNEKNQLLYIINNKCSLIMLDTVEFDVKSQIFFIDHQGLRMKIINKKVYILDSQFVYVYNYVDDNEERLKFINKFGQSILKNACDFACTDLIISSISTSCVLVLESFEPYLKIFNLENYQYLGSIKFHGERADYIYNHSVIVYDQSIYVHSNNLLEIKLEKS